MWPSAPLLIYANWPPEAREFDTPVLGNDNAQSAFPAIDCLVGRYYDDLPVTSQRNVIS